jgi:hypothetical protein
MSGRPGPIDQSTFFAQLIELLERGDFGYAVGGSVAAMAYSEPRFTVDIDLILALHVDQLTEFVDVIESRGWYVDPVETILEFNLPANMPISIVDSSTGMKADVYLSSGYGLDASAIERRVQVTLKEPARTAWFLSAEDVILYKLVFFKASNGVSSKHLTDIAKMLISQGELLDLLYLAKWASQLDVSQTWNALWRAYQSSRPDDYPVLG